MPLILLAKTHPIVCHNKTKACCVTAQIRALCRECQCWSMLGAAHHGQNFGAETTELKRRVVDLAFGHFMLLWFLGIFTKLDGAEPVNQRRQSQCWTAAFLAQQRT